MMTFPGARSMLFRRKAGPLFFLYSETGVQLVFPGCSGGSRLVPDGLAWWSRAGRTMASRFPALSTINLQSASQRFRRLEQFVQARYRNTFGRTVKYLARYIAPGGVVLDIGANHGKFAKNFARLHRGSCQVYCFEPLEYNYTLLERVVGRYDNVKVLQVALSDATGEAQLYVPAKDHRRITHGSAHLGDETRDVDFGTSTAHQVYCQTITTDTLDDVMRRENLDRLDFMKIDVEGAEPLVLRGGRQAIEKHKPGIYCELRPGAGNCLGLNTDDTITLLRDIGYEMYELDDSTGEVHDCAEVRKDLRDYLFLA